MVGALHSGGTCQSRSLICYVVPRVISLLRRRLIHVCIYLTQVPSHRFSDSSLSRTAVHSFLSKLFVSIVLFVDFLTCRGIALAWSCFLVYEEGLACGFRCFYLRSGRLVRVLFEFFLLFLCFSLLNLTFPFF